MYLPGRWSVGPLTLLCCGSSLKAGLHPTTLWVNLPQTLQQTGVLHNRGTAAAPAVSQHHGSYLASSHSWKALSSATWSLWRDPARDLCTQPRRLRSVEVMKGSGKVVLAAMVHMASPMLQKITGWLKRTLYFAPEAQQYYNNNIMYIYHVLINALNAHMIHININTIFYTQVKHSPTTRHSRLWHLELLPLILTGNYKQIWNITASIKISIQKRDLCSDF